MSQRIILLVLLLVAADEAFSCLPCKCQLGWPFSYIGSVKTGDCRTGLTSGPIDKIPDTFDTDIRALDMNGQSSVHLHENDIKRYKQLQVIELQNCELKEIPTNIFNSNQELIIISICFNKLSKIQNNLFSNLNNLKTINLHTNNISIIEENSFINLPALESLLLQRNSLKTLKLHFYQYKNLIHLDLHTNPWLCDENLYDLMNEVIPKKLWGNSIIPTCSNIEGKRWDKLQVQDFKPLASLTANKVIEEGEDLILECPINNLKIVWSVNHTRGALYISSEYNKMNESSGLSTMTLRNIRKWESGNYTCREDNCILCHEASTYVSVVEKNVTTGDSFSTVFQESPEYVDIIITSTTNIRIKTTDEVLNTTALLLQNVREMKKEN